MYPRKLNSTVFLVNNAHSNDTIIISVNCLCSEIKSVTCMYLLYLIDQKTALFKSTSLPVLAMQCTAWCSCVFYTTRVHVQVL